MRSLLDRLRAAGGARGRRCRSFSPSPATPTATRGWRTPSCASARWCYRCFPRSSATQACCAPDARCRCWRHGAARSCRRRARPDGVARSVYLEGGARGATWPHLALALLEAGARGLARCAASADRRSADRWPRVVARLSRAGAVSPLGVCNGFLCRCLAGSGGCRSPCATNSCWSALRPPAPATRCPPRWRVRARPWPASSSTPMSSMRCCSSACYEPLPMPVALVLSMLLAALPLLVLWARPDLARAGSDRRGLRARPLLLAAALLRLGECVVSARRRCRGALLSYPLWSWLQLRSTAAALAREREELNATLQAIGDTVIATDRAGRVIYLNPAAEALTSMTAAQAEGCALEDLFSLEDEHGRRAPAGARGVRAGTARSGRLRSARAAHGAQRRDPYGARERPAGAQRAGYDRRERC